MGQLKTNLKEGTTCLIDIIAQIEIMDNIGFSNMRAEN